MYKKWQSTYQYNVHVVINEIKKSSSYYYMYTECVHCTHLFKNKLIV